MCYNFSKIKGVMTHDMRNQIGLDLLFTKKHLLIDEVVPDQSINQIY